MLTLLPYGWLLEHSITALHLITIAIAMTIRCALYSNALKATQRIISV